MSNGDWSQQGLDIYRQRLSVDERNRIGGLTGFWVSDGSCVFRPLYTELRWTEVLNSIKTRRQVHFAFFKAVGVITLYQIIDIKPKECKIMVKVNKKDRWRWPLGIITFCLLDWESGQYRAELTRDLQRNTDKVKIVWSDKGIL